MLGPGRRALSMFGRLTYQIGRGGAATTGQHLAIGR